MCRVILMITLALGALTLAGCGSGGGDSKGDTKQLDVGSTTIFQAADDPSASAKLDMIISSGVDLNAKDKGGLTPLHHAVNANNANAVKRLLAAGADATVQDGQGQTAEDAAKQGSKADLVKVFDKYK